MKLSTAVFLVSVSLAVLQSFFDIVLAGKKFAVLGGTKPIPVDHPGLLNVLKVAHFSKFFPFGSSAFRLGRVLQAKQQIAAGHIYHAHFELIETDCDRQLTAAEDVSSCGEKRRLLCEATIWSKPSKREEEEEVEVTKFSCKSKE